MLWGSPHTQYSLFSAPNTVSYLPMGSLPHSFCLVFCLGLVAALTVTEIVDASGAGAGKELEAAVGVSVDPNGGTVYVSGWSSNNVLAVSPGGDITEVIDAAGAGGGKALNEAGDIVVNSQGDVFVVGRGTDNVFRITPGGVKTELLKGGGLDGPRTMAINDADELFVTGMFSDNVLFFSENVGWSVILDAAGAGPGKELEMPGGVAVGNDGDVFVSGLRSDNVIKVEPGGFKSEIVDGSGDGTHAMDGPWGLDVNRRTGDVYVACRYRSVEENNCCSRQKTLHV